MARSWRTGVLLACAACGTLAAASAIERVRVLSSTGGLPAHVAGLFQQPLGFAQAANGTFFGLFADLSTASVG